MNEYYIQYVCTYLGVVDWFLEFLPLSGYIISMPLEKTGGKKKTKNKLQKS